MPPGGALPLSYKNKTECIVLVAGKYCNEVGQREWPRRVPYSPWSASVKVRYFKREMNREATEMG